MNPVQYLTLLTHQSQTLHLSTLEKYRCITWRLTFSNIYIYFSTLLHFIHRSQVIFQQELSRSFLQDPFGDEYVHIIYRVLESPAQPLNMSPTAVCAKFYTVNWVNKNFFQIFRVGAHVGPQVFFFKNTNPQLAIHFWKDIF